MAAGFDRLLCFVGALGAVGTAAWMRHRMVTLEASQWALPSEILAVVAIVALLAGILRVGWFQKLIAGLMKLGLTTAVTFGIAEGACRVMKLDFNELLGARRANEAFPIYFRLPTHPSGEVFFTRPPDSSWKGKPLQTLLKNHRSTDKAYEDEVEQVISYSREGFRNPNDLTDWEVAVVGDSFTESGYLPEAEIFTGVAAAKLGKKVKNLGITDSGTFAQAHYLEAYGKAPSCKTAVLAFFEGNDLTDNVKEMKALETFKSSGERPTHDIPNQPSLLKAIWNIVRDFKKLRLSDRSYANAYFKSGGAEIPLTVADAPPSSTEMKAEERAALASGLDRYLAVCQKQGVKPHLLYLPCKRRVLHGMLRLAADYPHPEWQPGDLPAYLEQECQKRGITFIDSTPAQVAASQSGKLTFNTIYDTHNSAEGQRIIGEVLAEALK